MAQPTDTSAIQRLVRGARFRIRAQWALEGATTATILAAVAAAASIFAVRTQAIAPATGIYLLIASGLIIIAGAVIGASRKLDDETVARRIDRASNLADRLSTAIAFERVLANGGPRASDEVDENLTPDLMRAAIRDGVRAAPRANIRAATPFAMPKDTRVALGFLAVSALAAGLAIPNEDHKPHVLRVVPDRVRPGELTTIEGDHLMTGMRAPLASLPVSNVLGAANVPAGATSQAHERGYVPTDGSVFLGTADAAQPVEVLDWTATEIDVRIPGDADMGGKKLMVYIAGKNVGEIGITILSKKDKSGWKEDAVALDPDEKAYVEAILAELRNVAQRDKVPELEDFANKIQKLLEKADNGELSKEELLKELAKAEDALSKDGHEPNPEELEKQMGELGKELEKSDITKQLGAALEKNDLPKVQEELEKLAKKLDDKQLNDKQKEELGKQLDKVAKQMEKQQKDQQQKQDQQQQKVKEEIRRLEKQKEQAKNDKQRQEFERRLEDKKRELKKLQDEQQQKEQSEQRRALKRLQKDMEKAAENLQKPQKDQNQQQQDQQDQEQKDQQASRNLKDAARETGRVDQDRRKQATQKKMASQMDDLREAMRRAKQKGNKGPNDPFNKNGKNQDFISRARGQKGSGQAWKPGQGQNGQGQGQGKGQNGGNGSGSGSGDTWGTGHDDNLAGDPTAKSGDTKDADLQGTQGSKGGSTRETILAAAQKGFASAKYQKVYQDYQRIVEEVMRTEKLPSSYKYYVKRYFAKIHPSMSEATEENPK